MKYRVVSLFSGCGGLDYGFHNDLYSLVYAADNDEAAVKCFTYNFGFKAKKIDVQSQEFNNDLENIGYADVILGGFPCQGFSKAGPKMQDDPRNKLYLAMLHAVRELSPKIFIAENVDGMAQNYNGEFVEIIKKDFQKLGYRVEYKILNAVEFGAAQFRRRIIFIGTRKDILAGIEWPKQTHHSRLRNGEFKIKEAEIEQSGVINLFNQTPNNFDRTVTIKDSVSDLLEKELGSVNDHVILQKISYKDYAIIQKIGPGQKLCNVRFANTSVYTWQIPEVFGELSKRSVLILETIAKNRRKKSYGSIPNGNPLSRQNISDLMKDDVNENELAILVEKGYLKKIENKYDLKGAMFCSGLYKRPNWDEPSPTVITLFGKPRYFVHPKENRPFTVRECARLQTFPDHFHFLRSGITIEDAYRLIGNAVPPILSKKISEVVSQILNLHIQHETKDIQPKLIGKIVGI